MSHPNHTKRLEFLNVDDDTSTRNNIRNEVTNIERTGTANDTLPAAIHNNWNENTNNMNVVATSNNMNDTKPNLFKLPDGRMMDSKNTLQSFDAVNVGNNHRKNTSPVQPPAYTLPDGRMMDGKNTLQSFDMPPLAVRQAARKQQDQDAAAQGAETDQNQMTTAMETPTRTTPNIHSTNRTTV